MVEAVGRSVISSVSWFGAFSQLSWQTLKGTFTPPFRWKDFITQLNFVAVESAPIIAFCVSFAAVVTILESSFHMKMVIQNDSLVPGFASLLILRELGVVTTALLITSRVGAGLAAEVGSMKVTEQIDALKLLSIDPVRYLVVPRFLACVVGMMLLSIIANSVCLFFAMVVSTVKLGFTPGGFIMAMRAFAGFEDFVLAIVKGICFGAVIPIMSCFYGFRCKAGAEGVGLATTSSVVSTSIAIIFIDFVLSWIFSYLY